MFFLRLKYSFDLCQLTFELNVLCVFDYEGRIADDGAKKFLFGYLFEVGEAEFREEFLCVFD